MINQPWQPFMWLLTRIREMLNLWLVKQKYRKKIFITMLLFK